MWDDGVKGGRGGVWDDAFSSGVDSLVVLKVVELVR